MIRKIALLGTAVMLAAAVFVSSAGASGPPPIDATADHLHCSTNYGSTVISPTVTAANVLTPAILTFNLKGVLGGCADSDNGNVGVSGKYTGTISTTDPADFTALISGTTPMTGTITVAWKSAKGSAKLTVATTTFNVTGLHGGGFSPGTATATNDNGNGFSPDADQYPALGLSGSTTGSFAQASASMYLVTQQDVQALAGPLATGGKISKASIGIGAAQFG